MGSRITSPLDLPRANEIFTLEQSEPSSSSIELALPTGERLVSDGGDTMIPCAHYRVVGFPWL